MLWNLKVKVSSKDLFCLFTVFIYYFIHFTDRILFKDVLEMLPVSAFILNSCHLINLTLKGKRTKDKTSMFTLKYMLL